SGPFGGAPCALQGFDPVPADERCRGWIEQRVPFLLRDLGETAEHLEAVPHPARELVRTDVFAQCDHDLARCVTPEAFTRGLVCNGGRAVESSSWGSAGPPAPRTDIQASSTRPGSVEPRPTR